MEKTEAELYGAELGKLSILPDLETPDEELKKILAKQVELLHQKSNYASTSELIELSKVMASLLALQGGNQSFYGASMNHPYVVQLPVGDLIDLYVLRAQQNGYPIVDLRKSTCQEQKN